MSKQKDSTKPVTTKSKVAKYLRHFILIMLVYAFGLFLFQQSQLKSEEDVHSAEISVTPRGEKFLPDNELVEGALKDEYSVGAEPPLLRFSPKETDEIEPFMAAEDEFDIDPYVKNIEQESDISGGKTPITQNNNLKEYRLYLENANKLIGKFQLDQEYNFELRILEKLQLPSRVEEVVSLLALYNKGLIGRDSAENIKLFNSKLWAQFVTIKKMPTSWQEQKEFKEKIKGRLDILTDYIFSPELQNNFLEVEGL